MESERRQISGDREYRNAARGNRYGVIGDAKKTALTREAHDARAGTNRDSSAGTVWLHRSLARGPQRCSTMESRIKAPPLLPSKVFLQKTEGKPFGLSPRGAAEADLGSVPQPGTSRQEAAAIPPARPRAEPSRGETLGCWGHGERDLPAARPLPPTSTHSLSHPPLPCRRGTRGFI